MTNTNDNDIDALLDALVPIASGFGDCDICKTDALRCHAALTALVAERDALRSQMLELAWKLDGEQENRNALKRRVDELEDEQVEADRDLRERLVCAIWPVLIQQWREYKDAIDPRGCARSDALEEANKMLAAMRKGDANAE